MQYAVESAFWGSWNTPLYYPEILGDKPQTPTPQNPERQQAAVLMLTQAEAQRHVSAVVLALIHGTTTQRLIKHFTSYS